MESTHDDLDPEATKSKLDSLSHRFSRKICSELLHEDHVAFSTVCAVLIAIVSAGLLIGILGLLLSL